MPRCYILKKHVNQSRATVKDKSVLGDGNTTLGWQPKTNVALKRHDTPISPTEVNASICYNNTLENQSGKCFLKFLFSSSLHQTKAQAPTSAHLLVGAVCFRPAPQPYIITHMCADLFFLTGRPPGVIHYPKVQRGGRGRYYKLRALVLIVKSLRKLVRPFLPVESSRVESSHHY